MTRGRRLAVVFVGWAVMLGALALAWEFVRGDPSSNVFDSSRWRAADESGRGRMVHDLVRRGVLTGKTRTEVLQALGPPDSGEVGDEWDYEFIRSDYPRSLPFGDWPEVLVVRFGPDRSVLYLTIRD